MKPSTEMFPADRNLKKIKQRLIDRKAKRFCNICTEPFKACTVFDRYCPDCKTGSELLKFSEWLPEMSSSIQEEKIAA